MLKVRNKPIIVHAERYRAHRTLSSEFTGDSVPKTLRYTEDGTLLIRTLEGVMEAFDGDWIIRGVDGEFYPIKNDIFRRTYDVVEEPAPC